MTSAMGRDPVPTRAGNGAPGQTGQLQEAASGLLNQAARTADAQASTTMTRVGETLTQVAQAISDAAGGMRDSQPQIAGFAETAATKVDETATYLREHDASEVLDAVQQTARRQPALVVGGGLILGLLVGRFLRTGATATHDADRIGSGSYGGRTYATGASGYGLSGYDAMATEVPGAGATSIAGTGAATEMATDAGTEMATDAGVDPASLDVDADLERGSGVR